MHETKKFNIPCSLHGKLFLSHELFSVFVIFNEKNRFVREVVSFSGQNANTFFSRKLFSINQELYTLRLKNYESTKTYFHIHRPGQYIHSTQI